MRRRNVVLLYALLLMSSNTVYATSEMEKLHSRGLVLVDKESKRMLYEQHGTDQMAMASTTKIMTCILAIENNDLDEVVEVSKRASRAPKVKLGLQVGEKQRLGDLLYSLMMESHNDSAVAIAEHVGGSVEEFCEMMTDKARSLGAIQTSFETPNGLDGEHHYSTPYDMALIAVYALDNEKFLEILATLNKQIPSQPLEGSKTHGLINKNRFLREYPGALGVKTGYTSKAGHCFVGAAKRNDMTLIGVALGAGCDSAAKTRKYTDVKKMMNYGFKSYKRYKIVEEQTEASTIQVEKGKDHQLETVYSTTSILPLTQKEKETIQVKVSVPETIEAPIKMNQVVGRADVMCDGVVLQSLDIIAKESIDKMTPLDEFKKWLEDKLGK